MLSPTPFSLLCALLLCLPFAIVFTIITPTTITTTTTINTNSLEPPIIIHEPTSTIHQNLINKTTSTPPPPPLPDDDDDRDDKSLLRVASRVKSKPKSPKKIAFMFLTTTPLPFAPLWELFFNQTKRKHKNLFNIYIHADPKGSYDPPFRGVFAHRVIPSKRAIRFTPTLASAARRLLAQALLHDPSNSMFALFSPSCIPIHSFGFVYDTLANSNYSFIEILQNEEGTYDRWVVRGHDAMLPEVKLEDFRIGSQFWVLTRRHARIVVSDKRIWAKFNQPCVRWDTCYPEENYFPTLLHMSDPRGSVPATLTHVNWTGSFDGHPRMYESAEVGPELIRGIRKLGLRYGDYGNNGSDVSVRKQSDPFLFARKFHPNTVQTLLTIARDFIFKD
ncbi:Branch domain-containing protein [Cephalotus follicularis]|uniref:Branch domain-containing protein n=1 Tax=Cephalotus follicularis TaxID=3775 RepID=A0A1Q3D063_CEPFO|nr:Branch domain-containing protein [Cephalotus follicularis]